MAPRTTFAKLAVLILSIGACACALLAARQLRLQAVHELTQARVRIMDQDARLWRLRAEIGARVVPERVERMAARLAPIDPDGSAIAGGDASGPGNPPADKIDHSTTDIRLADGGEGEGGP